MTIAWFSCGVTSAVACKIALFGMHDLLMLSNGHIFKI